MLTLTPVLEYILAIAGSAVAAALVHYAKRAADRLGLEIGDQGARTLDAYVDRAIEVISKAADERYGRREVDWDDRALAATQWVMDHAPKAAKRAGYDAADVRALVRARLDAKD
ncbi:MAG: hypothetical protein ACLFSR_03805 [Halomonas sp.]